MIVGNLLTDPAAQSFISVADADDYLAPEQRRVWDLAANTARVAALVSASRWLADTMPWAPMVREPGFLYIRLGQVAARLAVEALEADLYAGIDINAQVASESVGSVSVSYFRPGRADAAGKSWPWLRPMLAGLIQSGSTTFLMRA